MVAVESRRSRSSRWCNCRWCFTISLASVLVVFYEVALTYWIPGIGIEDTYLDNDGHTVYRRKQDRLYKHHQGEQVPVTPFDGILEGHLTLVDLRFPSSGSNYESAAGTGATYEYAGVAGVFCHISWEKQAKAPWEVPMFRDLKGSSFLCESTLHSLDLYETANAVRQFDAKNHTFAAVDHRHSQGSSDPTLVVFHESRCGSTLVANTLSAVGRVFSESPPPVGSLVACEQYGICGEAQLQLIRDVFYLMGRAPTPQRVSYKIQSIGSRHIQTFRAAMPETPWMFVYRDGIEVLMSHFKHYQYGKNDPNFTPNCLKTFKSIRRPHPTFKAIAQLANRTVQSLTREEYCAAHLASLTATALAQHNRNHSPTTPHAHNVLGVSGEEHYYYVNYNQLPFVLWDHVLNDLLVGGVSKQQRDRMHEITKHYSKQRDNDRHWKEDTTLKQGRAPQSVKDASALFLDPIYNQLEKLRVGGKPV